LKNRHLCKSVSAQVQVTRVKMAKSNVRGLYALAQLMVILTALGSTTAQVGSTGAAGSTGATGPAGSTGSPGPAGSTGASGQPGLVGAPGVFGLPGIAGSTGSTGPSGFVGGTGSTGPQGPPGLSGGTMCSCNGTSSQSNSVIDTSTPTGALAVASITLSSIAICGVILQCWCLRFGGQASHLV